MRPSVHEPAPRSAWFTPGRLGIVAAILGALLSCGADAAVSRNVTLLSHLHNYGFYSACCSYVHWDGREYAVLGTDGGTSIVNITNPAAPYEVAFIVGEFSQWREMKQYRTWIYISTEAPASGIQIVNMANPELPVHVATYATGFNRAHTVTVDTTRALLILNGTRQGNVQTGMRVLSLASPSSPTEVASYITDYVHDSWVRSDTLFASCISSATMRVFKLNPPNVTELQAWTYPGARTHSAETSRDGRYLYVCDEQNYGTMKVFDIQDLSAHPLIHTITVNPLAIVHNVHVKRDTAFVSYYTEGVRLFDITDPSLPAEWGYYDTYGSFSGGFHGAWEVAPFFPSGTFIVSDIETGLYVFRATPDYGTIKVRVRDSFSMPVMGADVTRMGGPDSTRTQDRGLARLALQPGSHLLRVRKYGYNDAFASVQVTRGAHDSVNVTLSPPASSTLSGHVSQNGGGAALPGATIEGEGTPLSGTTDASGNFLLASTPPNTYTLRCDRPGYVPQDRLVVLQPGTSMTENWNLLAAAWYDSCDTDKGWSLSSVGDNATVGLWVRAAPVGTTANPAPALPRALGFPAAQHPDPGEGGAGGESGPVQPDADYSPGGTFCFVTGNGAPGGGAGDADVDGGKTTLTTPPLDMNAMSEPTIGFRRWYYMNSPGEPDSMLVDITADGTNWVRMLTLRESHPEWHHESIRVKDWIVPSATVRVRFIAQDEGVGGIVEAAVDDFELHDASLLPASVDGGAGTAPPPAALLGPRPNPAAGVVTVPLQLRDAGRARVQVFDVAGRWVATLHDGPAAAGLLSVRWDGRDVRGRIAASGVYWVRAEASGLVMNQRLVWLR